MCIFRNSACKDMTLLSYLKIQTFLVERSILSVFRIHVTSKCLHFSFLFIWMHLNFCSVLLMFFSFKYFFSMYCLPLKAWLVLCCSLWDTSIRYSLTGVFNFVEFQCAFFYPFTVQASFNSCSSVSSKLLSNQMCPDSG